MNVLAMEDAERRCCGFGSERYVHSGGTLLRILPVATPHFTIQGAGMSAPATLCERVAFASYRRLECHANDSRAASARISQLVDIAAANSVI